MTDDRLLTARDVGVLLGFAPGTIVDWAETGQLPGFKVGGRLRFRESEVLAFLEQRRVGPRPSRELQAIAGVWPAPTKEE